MKALLFQLVRSLEFELDARVEDIARKSVYVSRYSPLCRWIVLLTTFAVLQHCHPAVSPLSKGKGQSTPYDHPPS